MEFRDVLTKLQGRLTQAIERDDWAAANANLDLVAELALDALNRSADDDVEALGALLRNIYTDVIVAKDIDDETPSAAWFSAQLLSYAQLAAVATLNRKSLTPSDESVLLDESSVRILRALRDANRPMSGVDLKTRLRLHAGTIAHKLPVLRAAELVKSWPAGRLVVNQITPRGRQAINSERLDDPSSIPPQAKWMYELRLRASQTPEDRDGSNDVFGSIKADVLGPQEMSRTSLPAADRTTNPPALTPA